VLLISFLHCYIIPIMKILIVVFWGLLICGLCYADTVPADYDMDSQGVTIPLLNQSFFTAQKTLLLPLSFIGLFSGFELMVTGITIASRNTEAYGSTDMNRGIAIIISGLITSAISSLFIYGTLDTYN